MTWDKIKIYVERGMDIVTLGFMLTCVLLLLAIAFAVFVGAWNFWRT